MSSRSPPSFHPPCREDRAAVSPNTNHTGRQFNGTPDLLCILDQKRPSGIMIFYGEQDCFGYATKLALEYSVV
ncbi:hypothetical protein E2P81_ATG08414 [Venturia nashicola]|nr:hypothetical protein E2P81_ATG08414 [Venturia nashicola]